jgi:ribosome-associated heat shock protein Hsp15
MSGEETATRADKWLWRARFFKTRTLAAKAVSEGLRINGQRTDKPSATVRPGDVLTMMIGGRARVIEVLALGVRRGPAPEAQALYADRAPAATRPAADHDPTSTDAPSPEGRPDRRDRRALAALRRGESP